MPNVTVTTCGTSILTNGSGPAVPFLRENANKREAEYSTQDAERLKALIEAKRAMILAADSAEAQRASAELNGFISLYRREGSRLDDARKDTHYLIHTDTWQGEAAAGLLQEWGNAHGITMMPQKIDDLNTHSVEEFRLGTGSLVKWCEDTLTACRAQKFRVVFNLVGGFKSLQGYMQTLGMFYADESVYIFESGGELLSIPRLPLDMEAGARQAVLDNLPDVRRMQWLPMPHAECRGLPEAMLTIVGAECQLSEWGRILWSKMKEDLYSRELLPPASPLIRFEKAVFNAAESMEADRKLRLNLAMDRLCEFVDNGRKNNLKSLHYRKLEGDPIPPSTNEFNLWPDMGAWRGFCHEEGPIIIVDTIDMGLGHRKH